MSGIVGLTDGPGLPDGDKDGEGELSSRAREAAATMATLFRLVLGSSEVAAVAGVAAAAVVVVVVVLVDSVGVVEDDDDE